MSDVKSDNTDKQLPRKDGKPYKHDSTEISCPECGVVQKREVMAQRYQNSPIQYYIEESCPVCEFDGVWW